ncbi:MAG: FtsW/RodA/SpoVE family cell cycle protein [Thermoanaerobaculum sp.]|nr:FtsW/RodA/SpoVE family cell cycle protein [Thermoanaerobaculum sp.]
MPKRKQLDRPLLLATLVAAPVGIALVFSASAPLARDYYGLPPWDFANRQLMAWILGMVLMLAAAFAPLERLLSRWFAFTALALTWILLVIPYFQPEVAGTHRWLRLPVGSLQPSSLAKVTLPLALAVVLGARPAHAAAEQHSWLTALAIATVTAALVFFEPDLGTAILLLGTFFALLVVAETPPLVLAGVGLGGLFVATVGVLAEPYRISRVVGFFSGTTYQVQQALIALGSGGALGRGPGASVQKLFFLPQPHTDFIFAIAGEELGFVGALLLLALLGLVAGRCFVAAQRSPSRAAGLLACGVGTQLALQVLFHVGVCLGLAPAKGMPLPLISSGGSDLVAHLTALGLVLNVAKEGP